jgi:methyl-accepting chemotaxis protein
VARALEEQSGLSRRQLENLSRLEKTIQDLTRAVEGHQAASGRVREALAAMVNAAGDHEAAADGMSGTARALTSRAEALAERVGRYRT